MKKYPTQERKEDSLQIRDESLEDRGEVRCPITGQLLRTKEEGDDFSFLDWYYSPFYLGDWSPVADDSAARFKVDGMEEIWMEFYGSYDDLDYRGVEELIKAFVHAHPEHFPRKVVLLEVPGEVCPCNDYVLLDDTQDRKMTRGEINKMRHDIN